MHVRHYGIFVAYPPTVDLRDQGLGRHLAMFLKGAEPIDDIKFTILCPAGPRMPSNHSLRVNKYQQAFLT